MLEYGPKNTTKQELTPKQKIARFGAIVGMSATALVGGCAGPETAAQSVPEKVDTGIENTQSTPEDISVTESNETEPTFEEGSDEHISYLEDRFYESIQTGDELAASFILPIELTPQELGEKFIDNQNRQISYGSTPELDEWLYWRAASKEDRLAVYNQLADQANDAILKATFTDNYLADKTTGAIIQLLRDKTALTARLYNMTFNDNEPFRDWMEVVSVEDITRQDESTIKVLRITFLEKANFDKNRALELTGGSSPLSPEGTLTEGIVTFHQDGDRWVVDSWDSQAIN